MAFALANDWGAIEQVLVTWLETYGGLPANSTRWARNIMGRPALPYALIDFIAGGMEEGIDYTLFNYNAGTDTLDSVIAGPRRITMQLDVYTIKQSGPGVMEARRIVDQCISGLRHPANLQAFQAVGLAFLRQLGSVMTEDEQLGERWERRARVDLEFGYTLAFTDKGGAGTNYINTITGVSLTVDT